MFVIKRVHVSVTREGNPTKFNAYWNAKLARFGAEAYATSFSADEAEGLKGRLNQMIKWHCQDWLEVQPVNPEVKTIEAPDDCPQFERD